METETLELNERCLLTELADGSGVVLHLDTKLYYTLNTTGVEVWKAIRAGTRSAPEIAQRLAVEFAVDRATAETDLSQVLHVMRQEGLIRVEARQP